MSASRVHAVMDEQERALHDDGDSGAGDVGTVVTCKNGTERDIADIRDHVDEQHLS